MAENDIKLPDTSKLVVSSSPHYHDNVNIRKIMLLVIATLVPALAASVFFFGLRALWVTAWCALGCVGFEALFQKMMKRPVTVYDCSALLTGILLAMNLSVITPWWICLVGSLLAIGLGKMIYGGLGYNPFNPALVGRVGLLIAFPGTLTTWIKPLPGKLLYDYDAMTTATPLGELAAHTARTAGLAEGAAVPAFTMNYWDYFIGNIGGCIGETSALALLVGGAALIAMRLIRWQIPAAYLGTVAVITGITHLAAPEAYPATPLFHLLTGGLLIGAFYMATDMVTSPMSKSGAVVLGVGCGIITCVIRLWGSYPEGVSFSILFMNALAPLIDRYTAKSPFGSKKAKPAVSAA